MVAIQKLFAKDLKIIEIGDDDEWGMDRNEGIGGSEAGSVLGLNKYHTALDLLEEKVTRTSIKTFTKDQVRRMNCGHALEAMVLREFAEDTLKIPYTTSMEDVVHADGLAHLSKVLFLNPRLPFAFAHIDGLERLASEIEIVDAKVPFRSPWQEVPTYYIAQLAHYCAVIGGRKGCIAAQFQDHPYPVPKQWHFEFTSTQLQLLMKAEALFWQYVEKMRGGYAPDEDELLWLKETLSKMGDEFMSGIDEAGVMDKAEDEKVTLSAEDVELLIRYEQLKKEAKELYAEKDALGEYFKTTFAAPNVLFLSPEGVELAKKSTYERKDLDRAALAEAGVPVTEFYTSKPQSNLNTKKALELLAAKPESLQDSDNSRDSQNQGQPGGRAFLAGQAERKLNQGKAKPSKEDLADQDLPFPEDLFSSDLAADFASGRL